MIRYKIIDTTDNRYEGSIVEIDFNSLVAGGNFVIGDTVFQIDSIKIKGNYVTLVSSNYIIMMKKMA